MDQQPSSGQRLEETVRHIYHVTSEDFYADGRDRIPDDLANSSEVMIMEVETIAVYQKRLRDVLWTLFIKIGPALNSNRLREDYADNDACEKALRKVWSRYKDVLACLSPSDEDNSRFEKSYDDAFGRSPRNPVEKLRRDTMIYIHRLAEQLLFLLKEGNNRHSH